MQWELDERGNARNLSITLKEVKQRRWHSTRADRIPPIWREPVRRVLAQEAAAQDRAELAARVTGLDRNTIKQGLGLDSSREAKGGESTQTPCAASDLGRGAEDTKLLRWLAAQGVTAHGIQKDRAELAARVQPGGLRGGWLSRLQQSQPGVPSGAAEPAGRDC